MIHIPSIEPEWIPREQNEFADHCSRLVHHDDWRLNPVVFQWLDELGQGYNYTN